MSADSPTSIQRPLQASEIDWQAGIRALARLSRMAEQACQSTGISLSQYRLLVATGPAPQRANEVAAVLGVSRPTLTSLVDGLERGGLVVRRVVASDRRGIELELTDAGRTATTCAEAAMGRRLAPLLDEEMIRVALRVGVEVSQALDRVAQG